MAQIDVLNAQFSMLQGQLAQVDIQAAYRKAVLSKQIADLQSNITTLTAANAAAAAASAATASASAPAQ